MAKVQESKEKTKQLTAASVEHPEMDFLANKGHRVT
jgi:hypothetical protein